MDREILFRGKKIINGEWIEGADVMHKTVRGELCLSNVGEDWVAVIPSTVGQYTGLTDKNGRKIFEGDIVKNIDGVYVVEYCVSLTCFALVHGGLISGSPVSSGTVIGNIHDNPELIGEHKDNGDNHP